ncbi:aldose 1-epimerase family protein [Lactobacillus kefiranofaciens subsp. kefirgranum]|uniref:aldose 1-epimerase family protein n=1 Tax=Lactobacillus kefiranofaciens TaxID=267818 RepID=UPI00202F3099|nr:aldose 1-epimerase family protein [Lactobacillus kefiranofaciens]URW70688.1 aldose 1-epimerase family protein [Lactobacillus kefiranofaciens subsp. kefirgranum]URW72632.1 aldose 1-epimerase family protein [Lactobacillus kefiranofaciens subsp. kefirgranum]
MEQITIKNNKLEAKIALLGAEIQEVKNLQDDFSYIWTADKKYWGRHAPILFPFIGRSNENKYLCLGKTYDMKQHGFLRDQTFKVVEQKDDEVVLESSSTPETKAVYPYDYTVTITYRLAKDELKAYYQVENKNSSAMYYSFGFHPGLNITSNLSDYSLHFDTKNSSLRRLLIDPAPFRSGEETRTQLEDGKLALNYPMLDDGLIIFDVADISSVSLVSSKDGNKVTEDISDFPYLAIWSPEKKQAPFVCVEPFRGLPDKYGKPIDISMKDGEQNIIGHHTDKFDVSLRFN